MSIPILRSSASGRSITHRSIRFGPASALFQAAPVVIVESRMILARTRGATCNRCLRYGNSSQRPSCLLCLKQRRWEYAEYFDFMGIDVLQSGKSTFVRK